MTEAAARGFTPDAYAQDFTDYARVFTALGHPPDFDPRVEDADSAGALDVILAGGLGLATLGHVAFYVLGVLTDLGIEKTAEHGTERLWRRFRRRRKEHEASAAEGDPPATQTLDANGQPDVAELVTLVTARLPPTWAGQDGTPLEAVVEVQVKAYLNVRREHAGTSGEEEEG
jgi:hypothetical protein